MIRTGYLNMKVQTDHKTGSGYSAPSVRTVVHFDPICSSLWKKAGGRLVAVPVKVNGENSATLMMKSQHPQAQPIRTQVGLCVRCGTVGDASAEWTNRAACSPRNRPHGPGFEWVNAGDVDGPYRNLAKRCARQVCIDACPVRRDCADYARSLSIEFGVWGGVSLNGKRTISREDL